MVLLIDIFSINRSQGYEKFFLDIIVIELLFLEVSPSKRQVNISLSNQSALSSVILVSFWYYCGVVLVILLFIFHF
jgi:hypothetical protein